MYRSLLKRDYICTKVDWPHTGPPMSLRNDIGKGDKIKQSDLTS